MVTLPPRATALLAVLFRALSGLFGRLSYVVQLFTGSNTEFWQFLRELLNTRNYLRVITHDSAICEFMIDIDSAVWV